MYLKSTHGQQMLSRTGRQQPYGSLDSVTWLTLHGVIVPECLEKDHATNDCSTQQKGWHHAAVPSQQKTSILD